MSYWNKYLNNFFAGAKHCTPFHNRSERFVAENVSSDVDMPIPPVSAKPKSRRFLLVAVCVAVIVIALIAAVYCFVLPGMNSQNGFSIVTNFSDGAWANYVVNLYEENGVFASQDTMSVSATSGAFNGKDCWIYVEDYSHINATATYSSVTTYYLDKSTFYNMHLKNQLLINGESILAEEFNPESTHFLDDKQNFEEMTVVARGVTAAVQAGTFSCIKRSGTIYYPDSVYGYYDVTNWVSADVPAWGMVRYQAHHNGMLISEFELVSYGR